MLKLKLPKNGARRSSLDLSEPGSNPKHNIYDFFQ